jgi:hypothetical protein
VEVVGEQAKGKDAHATEGFVLAHEEGELFFFVLAEDELAIDDTRDAVMEAGAVAWWSFESRLSHGMKWCAPAYRPVFGTRLQKIFDNLCVPYGVVSLMGLFCKILLFANPL